MSSGASSGLSRMENERVHATTTIDAAPEAVFAVLADPSAHADIDGTGWVRASLDGDRITAVGQVFRVAMYHEGHPDKDYKIANLVEVIFPRSGATPATRSQCGAARQSASSGSGEPGRLRPDPRSFPKSR